MSKKEVSIYANGTGTSPKYPGRGGYGVVMCYNDSHKVFGQGFRFTTDMRMTVMGTIAGLEALKSFCAVQLFTDSKYLVDAMTDKWPRDWEANGWCYDIVAVGNNKPRIANADLWSKLLELCDRHTVEFNWIKEMSARQWHERCGEFAKEAADANEISYDDGYLDDILVRLDNDSALNVLLSELPPELLLDYAEKARVSGRLERAHELASKGTQRAAEELRAREKQTLLKKLRQHFRHDFLHVDSFYQDQCSYGISPDEYEAEKINFVQSWAENQLDQQPDRHQAEAIGAVEGNIQLVARAGSGKTGTLVNRALFLQLHCGVSPDEMLLLAFNRKAADEMRGRIASFVQESTPNVMTFHALAYAMIHPEKILFDEPEGEQSQSRAIQHVIGQHLRNPNDYNRIRALMMAHFRPDWERIVSGGYDRPPKEMLRYRRSLRGESLDGQYVKSDGEKAIANFLFEHGIEYKYERTFWWDRRPYRPDFTISTGDNQGVIIEYFGLKGFSDYDEMSDEKRNYWRNEPNWELLDYSLPDLTSGEDDLYALLKQHLERLGISCERLSEDEIWNQIEDRTIDDFTEVTKGFIQRGRKLSLTPEQLSEMVNNHHCDGDVEESFLSLALEFYASYLEYLETTDEEDFDGLVQKAAEMVAKGETIFRRKTGSGDLKRLRYILIDEYQDFSNLFYRLMQAIRGENPGARFFCVGDDWQAINGFAGSDLHFFDNFSEIFADSRRLDMLTNYRSSRTIVDVGNALMKKRGTPGRAHKTIAGKAVIADLSAFSPTPQEKNTNLGDYSTNAVLRLVSKIISDGKDVVLLSRMNSVPWSVKYDTKGKSSNGSGIDRLLATLRSRLPDEHAKKVTISTVHKCKGRQKNAVIVLDAIDWCYPLLHPNLIFTRVFGDSIEGVTDEERRLLYVALTRAVEELYILTKSGNFSPFLEDLEEHIKLSRLEWSDFPPVEDTSKHITIRVCNQDGRGSKPTVEIKDLLIAEGYRWDKKSTPWYIVCPADEFSVARFIHQTTWGKSAAGVEVRFCDHLDIAVAIYHVDKGEWKCVYDNLTG